VLGSENEPITLGDIIQAYEFYNGQASYHQIYDYFKNYIRTKLLHYETEASWKATIRKIVEDHSSDSDNFKGQDLFYSVEGIGKGVWGLRTRLEPPMKVPDLPEPQLPERNRVEVNRIIRDTLQSLKLKKLYDNKCQVCCLTIGLPNGTYSEAHHLQPLGNPHTGPDVSANIIILCPNHHTEFDYGSIAIEPSTYHILHIDKTSIYVGRKLELRDNHNLGEQYLLYHLKHIFGASRQDQQ
jgi:hypothetical protein